MKPEQFLTAIFGDDLDNVMNGIQFDQPDGLDNFPIPVVFAIFESILTIGSFVDVFHLDTKVFTAFKKRFAEPASSPRLRDFLAWNLAVIHHLEQLEATHRQIFNNQETN